MKYRREFYQSEEKTIKLLIADKVKGTRQQQKYARQALRDMGFYISYFPRNKGGFTLEYFEFLKKSGQIRFI